MDSGLVPSSGITVANPDGTLTDINTYFANLQKEITEHSSGVVVASNLQQDNGQLVGNLIAQGASIENIKLEGQQQQQQQALSTAQLAVAQDGGAGTVLNCAPLQLSADGTLQLAATAAATLDQTAQQPPDGDLGNSQPAAAAQFIQMPAGGLHPVQITDASGNISTQFLTLTSQTADATGQLIAMPNTAAATQQHQLQSDQVATQLVQPAATTQFLSVQGASDGAAAQPVQLSQQLGDLPLAATTEEGGGLQQQQQDQPLQIIPALNADGQQQLLLNTGGNSYQTVTIVPSDVNQGGEVSYVILVSQPEVEKVKQPVVNTEDVSVYDFKDENKLPLVHEDLGMVGDDDDDHNDETTRKVVKITPKRTPGAMAPQLMCNYCNYTSPKRYLLTRHMKTHSEERPHKCNICDRGFKTVASLQNHINTHTGVRPHRCKECDASFTTSGELVRHVRYRHTFEKPHKCTECDYSSVELSKLKRHMRSHTGERPYACPHCSYASPDTYKLKRHLRIHTGEKPYECEVCQARFTQSNSLKAHRLIHTGNKPIYQCDLCPTTCGRKTDLKIHVQKLHTSERPLLCKKCGKSFPDRYTYKLHVKTHEGEKCYKCELCPYAALSQRHLESHILTHTGEKPFHCDECDQSFRQKQLLKRHKNLYHTPDYVPPPPREKNHECSECGKAFAHRGNMLRHLAVHDPENPEHLRVKQEELEGRAPEDLEEEEALMEGVDSDELDEEEEGEITEVVVTQNENGEIVYQPASTAQRIPATSVQLVNESTEGLLMQVNENGEVSAIEDDRLLNAADPAVLGGAAVAVEKRMDDVTTVLHELRQETSTLQMRQTTTPPVKRPRGRPHKGTHVERSGENAVSAHLDENTQLQPVLESSVSPVSKRPKRDKAAVKKDIENYFGFDETE